MQPERVLDVWTEIVSRHALLASTVEYTDVNNVKFRSVIILRAPEKHAILTEPLTAMSTRRICD